MPATGGRINLAADGRSIDTAYLGFVVSPHEECAVEEAVRLVEAHGGETVVLTLGPAEAADQLRDALAIGVDRAVHLETDGADWDPVATASALVDAVRALEADGGPFDLILVGNESADSGGYQVGIRLAVALDRPMVNGAKALEVEGGIARARRQAPGGWEVYEVPLPAVIGVREGINLPRYPSVPGRLRARKKEIEQVEPAYRPGRPGADPAARPGRADAGGRDPRPRPGGRATGRRDPARDRCPVSGVLVLVEIVDGTPDRLSLEALRFAAGLGGVAGGGRRRGAGRGGGRRGPGCVRRRDRACRRGRAAVGLLGGGVRVRAWRPSIAGGSFDAVVAPGSERGTEILAHVAARSGAPMAANVVAVETGERWQVTRQRWAGSLLEDAYLDGDAAAC